MRRRAGWLPDGQDDLESWLTGHRQRVQTKGERVLLHPVIAEPQELHLCGVEQMLRLINEVLTMAPEFGENAVITPLCAILDWTMGTPAGFAAFRDPRINAMLQKILTAWCEFQDSAASLRFKGAARPLASPDDNAIVNACESTPYRLATGVKRQDRLVDARRTSSASTHHSAWKRLA